MHEILNAFFEDPKSQQKYGIKRVHAIRRVLDAAKIDRTQSPFTRFFRMIMEINGEQERMEKTPADTTKWLKFRKHFAKAGTVAVAWHVLGHYAPKVWQKYGLPGLDRPHELCELETEKITPAINEALKLLSTRHQNEKYNLLSLLWNQVKEGRFI